MSAKTIVKSAGARWEPSKIPGVSYRPLLMFAERNAGTYLVKMEPGTRYPAHEHPEGEEVFVVEGSMRVGGDSLAEGDYLYTPPGGVHDAETKGGCVFFVRLPAAARFLK
ncbi:MAG: cupin domain-containing protein [Acidobacteria bacterium]|nr:cupin domain-containing protein [Acidobacteriota bacterium]